MREYKAGDRVKIFCKANGGYILGTVALNSRYTVGENGYTTTQGDNQYVVIADNYSDDPWYIDAFRIELHKERMSTS